MKVTNALKKAITSVITLSMFLAFLTVGAENNAVFAQGVDNDGYTLIETAAELDTVVRNNLSGKYRLKNDIDLTGYVSKTNTTKNGWTPIGTSCKEFKGAFDGNGYTIKGLWIKSSCSYIGLFAQASGATIKNLNIEVGDAGISGCNKVGTIAGEAENGTIIENCNVTNAKIYASGYAGGIAGVLEKYATISLSKVSGTVAITSSYAGGIAGEVDDKSSVYKSCALVDVTACAYAGGAVGLLQSSSKISIVGAYGNVTTKSCGTGGLVGKATGSTISNTYARGNIKGTTNVGGLVGYLGCKTNLENSYSSGNVIGSGTTSYGAFNGYSGVTYLGTNYYDSSTTGVSRGYGSAGCPKGAATAFPQGKDTNTMMKQSTFAGWDFNTIWSIDEGKSYPYFDFCCKSTLVEEVTVTFDKNANDATGTMDNQILTKDTPTALNTNAFERDEHLFLGWSTTPTGDFAYVDGAEVTLSDATTLYAIWGTPDLYFDTYFDQAEPTVGD
ncbi:MAG: GLUG motif-containing protein, partial [Coprobacillaceae bacterium]